MVGDDMYSAIVLCAGSGTRCGLGYNKMFYRIEGKTVYEMTLNCFLSDELCQQVIVVTKLEEQKDFQELMKDPRIEFVEGGKERQDSVYAGLKRVKSQYVLIHDGARPFLKREVLDRLLLGVQEKRACLLMVPCKDTVKRVVDGKIVETLKRQELMQAQTPQAFDKDIILEAYTKGMKENVSVTDDAQMVEKMTNISVYAIEGDYENIKITTPEDLKSSV
jgi:2-C-methyl-D-erythritol 4-phosphate cytidylyltransferase